MNVASVAPVVASPQALVGLDTVVGEHAYVAETPQQWVQAIDLLLNDRDEGSRLSCAGQEFVREHHRWDRCLEPLGRFLHCGNPIAWSPIESAVG